MKRIISAVIALLIFVSTIFVVNADNLNGTSKSNNATTKITKTNANYKYTISDNTVTIDKYIGKSTEVSIPSKIDNKKVTAIGVKSFWGCFKLKSVKIPSTVTVIGRSAFDDCVALKSVTIPSSVKKIGNAAFFNCTRLASVEIPNSVETLGKGAFFNCDSLKTVVIPSSVRSIGDYAFGECDKLTSAKLSSGVKYVGNRMFLKCYNLTNVTLPNTIKTIRYQAFMYCRLKNFTIPESVTEIQENAFSHNSEKSNMTINIAKIEKESLPSVKNLTLGDKVVTIEKNAIYGELKTLYIGKNVKNIYGESFISAYSSVNYEDIVCDKVVVDKDNPYYVVKDDILYTKDMKTLVKCFAQNVDKNTTLTIPDTVVKIEDFALYNKCYGKINLPKNLKYIGDKAFLKSDNFTELNIPDTVTHIGEGAFSECHSLKNMKLPKNLKTIPKNAFELCENLKTIDIPSSVQKICAKSFSGTAISKIELPSSLTALSTNAFGYENKLKCISVDSNNKSFVAINNVLYSKDKKKLVLYPSKKSDTSYTILKGTEEIGNRAFNNNDYIETIKIPSTVKTIDGKAFFDLAKVKNYNVPSSVTKLGSYAIGFNIRYTEDDISSNVKASIYSTASAPVHKYALKSSVAFYTGTPKQNVKSKSIAGGQSFNLKISNIVLSDLVFTSGNSKIATVNSKGKVTGIKKGTTTIIATNAYTNYVCKVTVTSTDKNYKKTGFDESKYVALNEDNFKSWYKEYKKVNKNVKFTIADNPSIYCYTTSDYVYMKTILGSTYYSFPDKYYDQYSYYTSDLKKELSQFNLHQNTVLYSGTKSVDHITGTTSSIKDMKAAVGKTVTIKEMVSTSVDHSVALNFKGGETGVVLEIYAPANKVNGGYIEEISNSASEKEFLITQGSKYKIIDAGVRKVSVRGFDSTETVSEYERYMKLQVVG